MSLETFQMRISDQLFKNDSCMVHFHLDNDPLKSSMKTIDCTVDTKALRVFH